MNGRTGERNFLSNAPSFSVFFSLSPQLLSLWFAKTEIGPSRLTCLSHKRESYECNNESAFSTLLHAILYLFVFVYVERFLSTSVSVRFFTRFVRQSVFISTDDYFDDARRTTTPSVSGCDARRYLLARTSLVCARLVLSRDRGRDLRRTTEREYAR